LFSVCPVKFSLSYFIQSFEVPALKQAYNFPTVFLDTRPRSHIDTLATSERRRSALSNNLDNFTCFLLRQSHEYWCHD
jgi:hypothetical protein